MYREIVTKAVIGKGKIANEGEIKISVGNIVSKVLGCWIINHEYSSFFDMGKVVAKGKYDIHLWYGCNNDSDTAIYKQTVEYIEEFLLNIKHGEEINQSNEFVVKCIKYPSCNSLELNDDGSINVKIEKELFLDVIGETKLRVQISGEEDWCNNEDINNINVNYMNRK